MNQIVDLELIPGKDLKLLIESIEGLTEEDKMIDVINEFAEQIHMCECSLRRQFKLELGLTSKKFFNRPVF